MLTLEDKHTFVQTQRTDETVRHKTVRTGRSGGRDGSSERAGCEVTNHDTQPCDTPSMPLF